MSIFRRMLDWLPREMSLPEDEFRSRHRAMVGLLLLHLPGLALYGWGQGADIVPLLVELAPMALALGLAVVGLLPNTARAFAAGTGLLYGSLVLLHLSGGAAEASLHFLIVLAFTFLYRVWSLFGWSLLIMAASYTLLDLASPLLDLTGVEVLPPEMALGALVTAGGLASIGLVLAWKSAADHLRSAVNALEIARERDELAARRDAYGKMYVNLARRSQSLVDRQLTVIDQLEQDVEDPDILAGVFELDHLTTRVRRHGESLLVVADVDLPNRSREPVQLTDIVRGAQSEIEQYRRVDARIDPSIVVKGAITRDLVHVLAELLDNATTYSPPSTTVKVHARAGDAGSVVVTVEDHGLGLTPERLAQANADLQNTDALDENSIRHLGFRVIARLAEKHDITVRLTSTNGGVTAWVEVPATLVASVDTSNLAPARLPEPDVSKAPSPTAPPAPAAPTAPPAPAADVPQPPAPLAPPAPSAPSAPAPPVTPAAAAAPAPPVTPAPPAAPAPAPPGAPSQPATPDESPAPAAPAAAGDDSEEPAVTPATLSAGFSASGRRRRARRARTPVSKQQHDREPAQPVEEESASDATPSPLRPPTANAPLPTRSGRQSAPKGSSSPNGAAPQPPPSRPAPLQEPASPAGASQPSNGSVPALPRRERGATSNPKATEEALDLFGELDGGSGRASLGDFQRGQESARKEARE